MATYRMVVDLHDGTTAAQAEALIEKIRAADGDLIRDVVAQELPDPAQSGPNISPVPVGDAVPLPAPQQPNS